MRAWICRHGGCDYRELVMLLEQLMREGFLYKTGNGSYMPSRRHGVLKRRRSSVVSASYCRIPPDVTMTGIPHECWLFTRGSQSVRVTREEDSKGCRLFLAGPGSEVVTYQFGDVTECMKRQAEIERTLLVEGYQLAQASSDRRSERRVAS